MRKPVLQITLSFVVFLALHFILKLLEDAAMGWINQKIAELLGLQTPSVADVTGIIWSWGIPILLVVGAAWFYHRIQKDDSSNMLGETTRANKNTETPQGAGASPGDHMVRAGQTLSNQTITIANLVQWDNPVIKEIVFDHCTLEGPAIIQISGGPLVKNTFVGVTNVEELCIEITAGRKVWGAILFEECTFLHCKFKAVSIIGDRSYLDTFKSNIFPDVKDGAR